jgi:1,4-dihydroxy-2-naphthoate octaprenyltransferase
MAARPATLPAAVVPVVVGTAAGDAVGSFRPLPFVVALLCSLLIQIGTNFANDVFDFKRGAHTAGRLGPIRVTQGGLIPPDRVLVATYLTFGLAALLGLYLVWIGGLPILVIGVLSILAGLAYTGGPWPLGYHGLGDLFVFGFFGVLAVTGSAYLQCGVFLPTALIASISTGCLVTAILVVNNLRDLGTDRRAGKRTLAVRFGRRFARVEYTLLVAVAYVIPLMLFAAGVLNSYFLLPWITLPLALMLLQVVGRATDGPTLNRALKQTGLLHLGFGLLFAAAFWLS